MIGVYCLSVRGTCLSSAAFLFYNRNDRVARQQREGSGRRQWGWEEGIEQGEEQVQQGGEM
jgi:hypothetical protein